MNKSTILLTTTKVFLIHALSSPDQVSLNEGKNLCSLRWKRRILWVSHEQNHNNYLAALENLQWLKSCLKHSFVRLVCIDLNLGESEIIFWADSCKKANKPIFIRLSSHPKRLKIYRPFSRIFKSVLDRIVAAFLLILLSPFIMLMLLINLQSQDSTFSREWQVGKRGKLFQIIKFRAICDNIETKYHPINVNLKLWMSKYKMNKLLQLINVLKGEMSIVGPRPWSLNEILQLHPKNRNYLPVFPGIIGEWKTKYLLDKFDINLKYFRF